MDEKKKGGSSKARERILQAAFEVFSEMGFAGATTRVIANEAGVNEVTLFRHFGNKKKLFVAVMELYSETPALDLVEQGSLTGDFRGDLIQIATQFSSMLRFSMKPILLSLCEAQRLPELRAQIAKPPLRQKKILAQYLREQMDKGIIGDLPNLDLAAQAFFALFFEYTLLDSLLPAQDRAKSVDEHIAGLVDLYLNGVLGRENKKE